MRKNYTVAVEDDDGVLRIIEIESMFVMDDETGEVFEVNPKHYVPKVIK